MTIRNRPDYGVYYVNLTNAGSFDIPSIGSRVVLAAAWQGATLVSLPGGVQSVSGGSATAATVNAQIGKALGDAIAMQIGTKINVENKFDFVRLSWSAQAGVIALVMISDDADGNGVDVSAAPTVSLGTVSIVEGGNTANVENNGTLSVDITSYAGGTGVGAGIGLPIDFKTIGGGTGVAVGAGASNTGTERSILAWDQNPIGTSFFSNAAASGATTIVSPASNTNGVSVNTASFSGAGVAAGFFAGTSAPTSSVSNNPIIAADGYSPVSPVQIFLPAGQGFYFWSSAATQAYSSYTVH